jgi:glycine/D-amino acid oxidase-like deaminating enzyme
MRPDILILGQGLAGTMLGWAFEGAGISFAIADGGHAGAATAAAAGIISPITGRRLVKSWNVETFLPVARNAFRDVERVLGLPLWHEMRLRRIFADDAEREAGASSKRTAALAAFIEATDESGWWIRGAARVDLNALLGESRRRWRNAGVLIEARLEPEGETKHFSLVIDCRGMAGAKAAEFGFVPWEFSKGELLELAMAFEPDLILNRRFWVAPIGDGTALAGATHEPGVTDLAPTEAARNRISAAVRDIVGRQGSFRVTGQRVGVRVNLPDRRPVVGRHPLDERIGLVNGLGAKGALWAPILAQQWVNHLLAGAAFEHEIDVKRFARESGA